MKAQIEIKFLKVNGQDVNEAMLEKEKRLTDSALIFTECMGRAIKNKYFKKIKVKISDPTYICNWKNGSLYSYITFNLDYVANIKITNGKEDNEKNLKAFEKDVNWVMEQLENHTKKGGIEIKSKVSIENG